MSWSGASTFNLRFLANNRINMDFATFKNLNPEEVKGLSAQNLIDLLGFNLRALRSGVNETVVQVWIASHNESEVRKVGLLGDFPEAQPTDRPDNATVNDTRLCAGVNSLALNNFLTKVNTSHTCSFSIAQFACAETPLLLSHLSSDLLSDIFLCFTGPKALNRSDETALTVFLQKLDRATLMEALHMFNNRTQNMTVIPLMTKITFMNALWEAVRTSENLTSTIFLRKWFQRQFRPFIAGISQSVLRPLLRRNLSCEGYRAVLNGLNYGFSDMPRETKETVLRVWILGYLNSTAFPPRCYVNGSVTVYLNSYFQSFSKLLKLTDAFFLVPELLNVTDPRELADVLSMPGFINNNQLLTSVLVSIQPIQKLASFIDQFNENTQKSKLSPANRAAIIEGVWPQFTSSLAALNDTEVDKWLNFRLTPYLPFITFPLLFSDNSLRIGCLSYQKVVRALNTPYKELTVDKRKEIYDGIKSYLQQEARPKCYNARDPVLNSTAWFSQYLGLYLSQVSLSDLQSFSENETLLQVFAANAENLKLVENLMLSDEVSTAYINLLVKNNPNFNASSLPNSLLCFITKTNLLQKLTAQQTLSLVGRINKVCGLNLTSNTSTDGTVPPEEPTDEQLKLAVVLVGKIDNFSVSTLNTLGQTAVGLSLSQVDNIDGNTLEQALPSLGNVRGWNIGQTSSIVNKLLTNGFKVNNSSRLLGLGSLVSGIPSGVFRRINPQIFISVISNERFVENIGRAPQPIRQICVLQVLRNVENPVTTVKAIPSVLAAEVPPVLLNSNLSLGDVNNKEWTPSQSAVFFERLVRYNNNFEIFSVAVLRGFSCGATKALDFQRFLKLVQAMKVKGIMLDESQLECISGRLASESMEVPLDALPGDVLLFNYQYFRASYDCRDFYKLVGKSNVNILRKVSVRERNILNDARMCLGIMNRNLTKEDLTILGGLVCDIDGSVIRASDLSVLDALKNCVSFRDDQKEAIEILLRSGKSRYGLPSSWSSSTIQELGNLPLALTATWSQINRPTLKQALPRFLKKIKRFRSPGDVLIFIAQLKLQRSSNNTSVCTEGVIAPEDIDDFIPAVYDAAQLDICLSDHVLRDGVLQIGSLAFDPTQLKVLKKKLLQIYPNGLPESQIQLLGNISTVFNATEVHSWNITRVETISALLAHKLENTMVKAIIGRYLQLDGSLNVVSLKAIGGNNLCTLDEEQLMKISNLTDAGALDFTACSQPLKNILYNQAVLELNAQQQNPIAYYQLIKVYLGGASTFNLRFLANNRVNMDFATFKNLNPEEVKVQIIDCKPLIALLMQCFQSLYLTSLFPS
ncbi:uncharacterized protein LOC132398984 [Hypanus sabinus]|uniref:uncharacterized protein LOC132398984 n=1 Tax=Hypanus sabinus TaxID=79690 RepID=UPI0028C3A0A8|nr:uncharacterized protein LOC132398984 [Hypanus sabinus]